ncbi:HEPN domain-containing protein [Anaerocolumna sp. MB42-C2]|uniref:HEPN domain-containing protein n=1 Tax=Anaerocolumna sp. MB42-C2 TaxID=3070997 RepID=UPI0027E04A97|nr:HEPN domain-containing protein [Anaerocolumna sp. MB42-C2]WMJ88538.1 HEPN domain-containing protein [Anaerocolumna sp. MB42-C2]
MEGSINDLAKYRFEKAEEDLETARMNHNNAMYKASINRSYYAIFHGMRAVTILNDFDSSKHSGIIAFFNQNYIKTGIFDKELSKVIASASKLREKSDYVDFYIASKQDSHEQLVKADGFLEIIKGYLKESQVLK